MVATSPRTWPGRWPALPAGTTHVILAGHRRHAAAVKAGRTVLPCVVRDDLAGDDALIVMLAENDPAKRHQLPVLGEARAFAELASRGWSQRQIAQRMGCGQSHVSKRIALLKLPEPVTAAIADGRVTAADGAELVRLAGHPEAAVKALTDLGQSSWLTAAAAVNRQLQQVQRQEAAEATRAQFEAQGIPVVDPGVLGPYGYAKRLHDGTDLEPHRAAGCLVGAAASHNGGPELYCREPDSHEGTAAALPGWSGSFGPQRDERDRQAAEQARHRKAAAQSRRAVAAQLAARSLPGPVAADLIARTLIARHADAHALKTAMGWLRAAGIGPAEGDYYAFAEEVTEPTGSDADVRRLAVAMALAVDERLADGGEFGNPEWGRRQVAYLDRLISETGYEPGSGSRRGWTRPGPGSLPATSCRARPAAASSLKSCESVYPRCDVEQDPTGAWSYRCACKGKPGPEADGPDADDVYDALEDLLIAISPSTSAGARLPEALREAIKDHERVFAELHSAQAGRAHRQSPGSRPRSGRRRGPLPEWLDTPARRGHRPDTSPDHRAACR